MEDNELIYEMNGIIIITLSERIDNIKFHNFNIN